MLIKCLIGPVIALAMASPVMAQTAPAPCVLVMGGSIQDTGNPKNNDFWLKVDQAVTDDLTARLKTGGYAVQSVFESSTTPDHSMKVAISGLNATGCSEVIQVATALTSQDGHKLDTWGFGVVIMRYDKTELAKATQYTAVGAYSKDYSYPATTEVFQTLGMDDVAAQMITDMEAGGVLAKFKAQ